MPAFARNGADETCLHTRSKSAPSTSPTPDGRRAAGEANATFREMLRLLEPQHVVRCSAIQPSIHLTFCVSIIHSLSALGRSARRESDERRLMRMSNVGRTDKNTHHNLARNKQASDGGLCFIPTVVHSGARRRECRQAARRAVPPDVLGKSHRRPGCSR